MRLIDADDLAELFDKGYKATRLLIEQGEEHLDNLAEGFAEAHHVIQRVPTIEAEPVRHGKWKLIGADKLGRGGNWKCDGRDGCGKLYPYKCDYCPNCGAKMDKEGA